LSWILEGLRYEFLVMMVVALMVFEVASGSGPVVGCEEDWIEMASGRRPAVLMVSMVLDPFVCILAAALKTVIAASCVYISRLLVPRSLQRRKVFNR